MSKFDPAQARKNMVDCQIHPSGVVSAQILNVFETIPREQFVPEELQGVAYGDEDLHIGFGRYLLEPMVHAKMLEAADLKATDVVLDVGCATGYSSALMAPLVSTVIAVDDNKDFLKQAALLWDKHDICNVVGVDAPMPEGNPKNAPYDVIVINGAVAEIPQAILAQLAPEGRLVCILKDRPETPGHAVIVRNVGQEQYSSYNLFDARSPYLTGFAPKSGFQF